MTDVQVKYTSKQSDSHEGITHVGSDGWRWATRNVIASIEQETNTFYTLSSNNARASVGVVNGSHGKYLRTYADGQWTNNLLSLPDFPRDWVGQTVE